MVRPRIARPRRRRRPEIKPPERRILFLTGTRADFGKLKPLIEATSRTDGFETAIFATGMHMLARYGATVNEIRKAKFANIFTYINQDGSRATQMDLVLATTVQGIGHYIREYPPDLLVVHGDRIETLAGAIVGALNNILVAHIEGGEVSGTVDELIRHAVTKLSHLHFVANDVARNRLLQMGERAESVFTIGSPDVDVMLSDRLPSLTAVKAKYGIPFAEYVLLLYHPVTTELPALRRHAAAVFEAVKSSGMNAVVIYPNNDAGAEVILERIDEVRGDRQFRVIPSMRFEYFLALLKNAVAIVGNSSAGVREAPVYGVPTINVGTRQLNRYRYASIVDVPDDKRAVLEALRNLPTGIAPSLHFGKGESGRLFRKCLLDPRLWETCRQKQFRDVAVFGGSENA
jgi:UDP-N-acetylglucosamine 2-epimerase (hydrolysing)